MGPDHLRDRIADQFSYRGERADVWRVFGLFLDTGAFLNLGYSEWYRPHLLGSSQRRLAATVGRALSTYLPSTDGARLLDVGCGRGGPAIELADRLGFRVTGVDLVPYNVAKARANAASRAARPGFVVGDATQLPFAPDSLAACTAIDALVYLPDRVAVLAELATVLEPGGVVVLSDLVATAGPTEQERQSIAQFAESWDMPPPWSVPDYRRALTDAGFDVRSVEDLTPHSVGRFRKWTALFTWLRANPVGFLLDRFLERRGIDPGTVVEQIRHAHGALPSLRHVLVVAELRE